MRRLGPVGLVLSALLVVTSGAALAVSLRTARSARETLDNAERLHAARLEVAEAEGRLGESDLDSAVASAREANRTAARVGSVTDRIATVLGDTDRLAAALGRASARGVTTTRSTRLRMEASGALLEWIAAYQDAAVRTGAVNNAALERTLRALRETNRSFPGTRP